jgi:histidinol-phosphate aminotransferase
MPKPVLALQAQSAYRVPRHSAPMDLLLDSNEGPAPDAQLLARIVDAGPELARRYPLAATLERVVAARLGLQAEQVLVTAGADDAIDRCCRAFLSPARNVVMPSPTFEMLPRYARLTGAAVREVPWSEGPYPVEAVLDAVDRNTSVVVFVSPNNPTGAVGTADDLRRLAAAAPHALLLVDLAYGEFADSDLTAAALSHPNAVVLRTMSKAWGLAGLRVGFALGPVELVRWLRAIGQPYAVSGPSLLLAKSRLQEGDAEVARYVASVREERGKLEPLLRELGADVRPSHANFVYARTPRARWIRDGLAGLGIAVRIWPGHPELEGSLRVSCPGDGTVLSRLQDGLRAVMAPEALLLDMDGVLADVSKSYRQAVQDTVSSYGVSVTQADITRAKSAGNSNNDWILSHRLLAERGMSTSLQEVTARFEQRYQGSADVPGLWRSECLIPSRDLLERLAARLSLAIVTGRPRHDAERFLEAYGIAGLFRTMVCMHEASAKPDPAPVRLALEQLGVRHAWMVGDTPDDIRAARAAGVVPIGVVAPGDAGADVEQQLLMSGASCVLGGLAPLEELLA